MFRQHLLNALCPLGRRRQPRRATYNPRLSPSLASTLIRSLLSPSRPTVTQPSRSQVTTSMLLQQNCKISRQVSSTLSVSIPTLHRAIKTPALRPLLPPARHQKEARRWVPSSAELLAVSLFLLPSVTSSTAENLNASAMTRLTVTSIQLTLDSEKWS